MLKSDTASFEIPEIDFYMNAGTLGDKFTTVEGLLKDLKDNLFQVSPFSQGDSETQAKAKLMDELLKNIDMIREGERLDVTIILDDPSGNSYLQVRPAGIRNLMK